MATVFVIFVHNEWIYMYSFNNAVCKWNVNLLITFWQNVEHSLIQLTRIYRCHRYLKFKKLQIYVNVTYKGYIYWLSYNCATLVSIHFAYIFRTSQYCSSNIIKPVLCFGLDLKWWSMANDTKVV